MVDIYWKNKPKRRWYDSKGKYREWRTATYSGHLIANSMLEAVNMMQELMRKGDRDVQMKIRA